MMKRNWTATLLLLALALLSVAVHCLVNHRYGFHRDELPVIDDARHLAWGYPAYPPITPLIARLALTLFGPSLAGLRLFSAIGFAVAIVIAGLMARELGAGIGGQTLAAASVAIAPVPVHNSSLFQYVTWDYLAWVLCAYFLIKRCRSGDERWWIAIGASMAFGILSKYTMAIFIVALTVAVLLTPLRRDLAHKWLWLGALLGFSIVLPHIIWEIRNHFVSFAFLADIRSRDYQQGRSDGFLLQQLFVAANPLTVPLWLAGLWFYLISEAGQPFRAIGFLYFAVLILFSVLHGRSYYLAPAYPMLLAAGSYVWAGLISGCKYAWRSTGAIATILLVAVGGVEAGLLLMPVAPIQSPLWQKSTKLVDDFAEEIGWTELTNTVAKVYHAQSGPGRVAILCGNYGEAGAINLFGPARKLPPAISAVNSYWGRGYGQPEPNTIILVGFSRRAAERYFSDVSIAGHVSNQFSVSNEESREHPEIFVCRQPKFPWPTLWRMLRSFG
ncbi:MAG: glycosyltransferase family 39 protein [Verrucomicrobia bacterium]|nr:glycosyltransferase family 39 protein [Verrucomicrobiota bacterium]